MEPLATPPPSRPVRLTGLAAQGVLLFLFVPLVLFLFLRQPLGPGWSVGVGLVIMAGHRVPATAWMAKFADVRCLWCGRVGAGQRLPVLAGGREWTMTACSAAHAASVSRFLGFVYRFRAAIACGILLPLGVLLAGSLLGAVQPPVLPHALLALQFRIIVAATVVAASLGYRAGRGGGAPLRCPVPLHNLFLLGIRNTLWVFRLVGAWWLVDGLLRAAR